MERNLYAPPAAPVADPGESPTDRPRPVAWALWLLWVSLGIGLVAPVVHDVGLFTFDRLLVALSVNAIRYVFTAWINIKISQGRNWARILVLLWMLVAVAVVADGWRQYLAMVRGNDLLAWTPTAAKFGLDCVALALLFTPAANRWFRKKPDPPAATH